MILLGFEAVLFLFLVSDKCVCVPLTCRFRSSKLTGNARISERSLAVTHARLYLLYNVNSVSENYAVNQRRRVGRVFARSEIRTSAFPMTNQQIYHDA